MSPSQNLWNKNDLIKATSGTLEADVFVQNISLDTRHIQKGDLFIAIKGDKFDGHDYIEQAFEKNASCVLADNASKIPSAYKDRILLVEDSFIALQKLARFARSRFKGRCIAVTGSVGKTTTKEMLRLVLSAYGTVHASAASHNNHLGVPLTLARLPQNTDFCICEVGMNHPGEISELAHFIKPHYALITTIGTAHLGYMGSILAIAQEKASLFSSLQPNGVGIAPYLPLFPTQSAPAPQTLTTLYKEALTSTINPRLILCDFEENSNEMPSLTNLSLLNHQTSFEFKNKGKTYPVTLSALGRHLGENATLILSLIDALDLPLEPAIHALKSFKPGSGRGLIRKLNNGATLIDESYNASKESMIASIAAFSLLPAKRHIVALGDMLELGEFSQEQHIALLPILIKHHIVCFCCGKYMKFLYDALPDSLRGGYAINSQKLAPLVRDHLHIDDILLVKGSLGSQMHTIIHALD